MDSHYSRAELQQLGLKSFGEDVTIDRSCRLYRAENIAIGSHVRIDAFCVLSASAAGIVIGEYVHLSTGVTIVGREAVVIEDFVSLSVRTTIFSSTETSCGAMTGPLVPEKFRRTKSAPVLIKRHAAIGAGSVLLPGVTIGVGAGVGAMTLVRHSVPEFTVVVGNPMKRVGKRGRIMLEAEKELREASASFNQN